MDPNDPDVIDLSKAIFKRESGGDFNAVGDAGTSHGAGQWQPGTWKAQAKDVLGDENAPMTPDNQKAVIQVTVAKRKAAGLNPAQIAAEWNSGKPDGWENKIGTTTINGQQIHYDVPAYVKAVTDHYQEFKSQRGAQGFNPKPFSNPGGGTAAGQFDFTGAQEQKPEHSGFFEGIKQNFEGTNPDNIGTQLETAAKGVGNFLFPSVGDAYHLIKGDNEKTGLQLAGNLGSTALGVASLVPGIGEGALALKAGLTGAKLAEGAGVAAKAAPSLLGAVTKNAALGAGFGVSGALGSGATDPTKILESTALGAGTGGLLGAAGNVIGSKVMGKATQTAEGRLTEQATRLKTLTKALKDNTKGDSNPIRTFTDLGLTKSLKVSNGKVDATALTNAERTGAIDNLIESHSEQATNLVNSLPGFVHISEAEDAVLKAIASNPAIRDVGGVSKAQAEAKRIFADYRNSFGEELPYPVLDNIRAGMNRVYDPAERDVARTIGDTMRDYLYNGDKANDALRAAMQSEGELIRARNFAEKVHGTTVPGGQLGKYFQDALGAAVGGAVGTAFGGPLGGAAGMGAGAFATDKAAKFFQGNYFNPIGASSAGALQRAANSVPGKVLRGGAKAATLQAASGAI